MGNDGWQKNSLRYLIQIFSMQNRQSNARLNNDLLKIYNYIVLLVEYIKSKDSTMFTPGEA
jgi:hypothetical protein